MVAVCKRGHKLSHPNFAGGIARGGHGACRACTGDSTLAKKGMTEPEIQKVTDDRYRRILTLKGRVCAYCGEKIDVYATIRKRFCGYPCAAAFNREQRLLDKDKLSRQKEEAWRKVAESRARKFGVFSAEVNRIEIAERDKWVCYLCQKPIPKEAEPSDSLGLHIEHLIPLIHGGAHTPENCAASHMACNLQKGTSIGGKAYEKLVNNVRFYVDQSTNF